VPQIFERLVSGYWHDDNADAGRIAVLDRTPEV
jgi:hypothetical protein